MPEPPPVPVGVGHLRALINATHYHQGHGRHPVPRAIPPGRELIELVTGGRGQVLHEGRWVDVVPGTIVWQIAGDQTIGRSDFEDPYRCLALHVEVDGDARRVPRLTRWNDLEEVRWFTREAVRWAMDDVIDRASVLAWLYGRLLFQACLSVRQERAGALPAQLRAAQEAIAARYAEPLRLAELARRVGWSPAHLHAQFRAHLGTSPHQYLIQRRLRAARELLAATTQPIGDVALACGFADAAAFCRTFKQAMGSTPAAFRRAQG